MKVIDGQKFIFDPTARVPKDSEAEIARSFLYMFQQVNGKESAPLFMGGPNPTSRVLVSERRLLVDGSPYFLVRGATEEENDNPGRCAAYLLGSYK